MKARQMLLLGLAVIAAGLVAIVAGWVQVQNEHDVVVQVAYLASGGFIGVALVVLGTGVAGHADLRAIRATVEELRERFDDLELDLDDLRRREPGRADGRGDAVLDPVTGRS